MIVLKNIKFSSVYVYDDSKEIENLFQNSKNDLINIISSKDESVPMANIYYKEIIRNCLNHLMNDQINHIISL
jgi:hypothetical protein